MLARTAGIWDEAVALHQQRIFHLDRLDRQVRRVGDVHLHAVLAVLREAAAEAAAQRLEIDVVAVVARIVAEEHGRGVRAIGGTDRRLGDGGRQRADDDIDDALRGVGARGDRGRERRVDQRSQRRLDLDDIHEPLIVGHVGVEQRLERVEHAGLGCRHGAIDVALHLRSGAGEVEQYAPIAARRRNDDPDLDRDVGRAHPVVVHHVGEAIFPWRDAGDRVAQAIFRAANDLVERGDDQRYAARLDHLVHAPHAQAAGRDLGEVIAAPLVGNPRIEQQEVEHVLDQLALAEQPYDGDAQTLLIDLRHAAGHAARRHAADVGMVGDVAHEADELAVREHRHRKVDVGQMRSAGDERIVGDENVALVDVGERYLGKQSVHQPHHRAEMDGERVLGLHDQPALRIDDRGRVIVPLLDVGRIGALHQRDVGLVGDGAQAVRQDFERDRVDGGAHGDSSTSRLR